MPHARSPHRCGDAGLGAVVRLLRLGARGRHAEAELCQVSLLKSNSTDSVHCDDKIGSLYGQVQRRGRAEGRDVRGGAVALLPPPKLLRRVVRVDQPRHRHAALRSGHGRQGGWQNI